MVLRGLVLAGSEYDHVHDAFSSYYLDLIVELAKTFRESHRESWATEEVLMKISDDRDNFVSVLKENNKVQAKQAFKSAKDLLRTCLKKGVMGRIREAQVRQESAVRNKSSST